ncbi:MAG: hypothetical protein ABNH00_01440 [Dokdonia sp.]|jgi:hypothetical protein
MKKKDTEVKKTSALIDTLLNRHKTWKSYRKHTQLKLIRFA